MHAIDVFKQVMRGCWWGIDHQCTRLQLLSGTPGLN